MSVKNLVLLLLILCSLAGSVGAETTGSNMLTTTGRIVYPSHDMRTTPLNSPMRGVARAGFFMPTTGAPRYAYSETRENFEVMMKVLPKMTLIQLAIQIANLFPNSLNGDFETVNAQFQEALDNMVSWAEEYNVKVILGCHYWQGGKFPSDLFTNPLRQQGIMTFLRYLAGRYPKIVGLDIINEPYNTVTNWNYPTSPTIEQYVAWIEEIVDDFRTVNPKLTAYVQPPEGASYKPMDWVRTNPVKRSNVVYCPHPYAIDWYTGSWRNYDYAQSYKNGNYELAKTQLEAWLYNMWGFIKQDLGLPLYIGEFCALETEAGLRYLADFLELLRRWNASYTYFCWASGIGEPCALAKYPEHTEPRAMVNVLKADMT